MSENIIPEILRGLEVSVRSRMEERKAEMRQRVLDDFERMWAEEAAKIAVTLSRLVNIRMMGPDTLEIRIVRDSLTRGK